MVKAHLILLSVTAAAVTVDRRKKMQAAEGPRRGAMLACSALVEVGRPVYAIKVVFAARSAVRGGVQHCLLRGRDLKLLHAESPAAQHAPSRAVCTASPLAVADFCEDLLFDNTLASVPCICELKKTSPS